MNGNGMGGKYNTVYVIFITLFKDVFWSSRLYDYDFTLLEKHLSHR